MKTTVVGSSRRSLFRRLQPVSVPAVAFAATFLVSPAARLVAGTPVNFTTNGDLTAKANYSSAALPTSTTDVQVTTTTAALTDSSSTTLRMESLNLTDSSPKATYTLTDRGTGNSTLTLGGTAGFTNAYSSLTNDLLYLQDTNFTITGSYGSGYGTQTLALASSGNFDLVAGSISVNPTLTISASITGAFGLTITGTGTTTLSASNTFSGPFAASGSSTVALAANGALGSVSAVNLSGSAVAYFSILGLSNVINSAASLSLGGTSALQTEGSAQTVASLTGVAGTTLYVGDYTSSASPPVTTAGSFTVGDSTSTTFAGTVVDAHGGTGAGFTKQGTGTLTLTGNNTLFTSPVAITGGTLAAAATGTNKALGAVSSVAVNNGGTLLLGNSNQVNTAATMTLGSTTGSGTATFNAAGFSQGTTTAVGVGALTLAATATLDFGAGNTGNVLHFANSGAATWTVGSILYVSDYTGSVVLPNGTTVAGTTTDALLFGSDNTGLNATEITQVEFINPNGYMGTYGASIDSTGMIFADVPEPATCFGGALLVGALGWHQRRRRGFAASWRPARMA